MQPLAESTETVRAYNRRAIKSGLVLVGLVLLPLLGGLLGFAGYLGTASMIEARRDPSEHFLSYGKQAMLMGLPLCTVVGTAIGLGGALVLVRRHKSAFALLLLTGLCGSGAVYSMWSEQIARYGRDPSEVVLYYPPLAVSMLALVVALAVCHVSVFRWRSST